MTDPLPSPAEPRAVHRAAHAPVKSVLTQRQAAEKLEASFLAEMLKSAGVGKSPSFEGGSYQRQALAEAMVKSGGIGLAETFYQALVEKQNDQ